MAKFIFGMFIVVIGGEIVFALIAALFRGIESASMKAKKLQEKVAKTCQGESQDERLML